MKMNNILLFAILLMLTNVSFANTLKKSKKYNFGSWEKSFLPDAKIEPNKIYYLGQVELYLSSQGTSGKVICLYPTWPIQKSLEWKFIKNEDGSYLIQNVANNLFFTTNNQGGYDLLPKTGKDDQKFTYKNRDIKSHSNNNCLQIWNGSDRRPKQTHCGQNIIDVSL